MLLSILSALALITATLASIDVHRASAEIPSGWSKGAASQDDAAFDFTLHLYGADMPGLSTKMEQIAAENQGGWLSDDELGKYVSPSPAATEAVESFLKASGIPTSSITTNRYQDRVTVKSTIAQVSKLFSARMYDYQAHGVHIARATSYIIPAAISTYVQDISPIAFFGLIEASGKVLEDGDHPHIKRDLTSRAYADQPASCNISSVTPQCRRDYYGTADYQRSKGGARADVAVIGFNDQLVDDENLNLWYKDYAPYAVGSKVPITAFNGALQSGFGTFEGLLNTETVVGEIYPLTTTFLSMAPRSYRGDPWLLAFNTLIEQYTEANRPKVLTISYDGDERHFSPSQAQVGCEAAQKLTALGTTIVVSSGDYGIAGTGFEECKTVIPRYPNTCEHILSVGATEGFGSEEQPMEPNSGGLGALSSGAGSSNIFAMPSYQIAKVKAFQKIIGPLGGAYNMTSRFYPDISAQGSRYSIRWRGKQTVGSGTSASAPYVASLIALINDKRAKVGKGQVGWANPRLYTNPMKDITKGGVYGCSTDSDLGFKSVAGFDGAGNGTPTLALLSKAYGV